MDHLEGEGIPRDDRLRVRFVCDRDELQLPSSLRGGADTFHSVATAWTVNDPKCQPIEVSLQNPTGASENELPWQRHIPSIGWNIRMWNEQKQIRTRFVQRWLFFELLRAIFQNDVTFRYIDFISEDRHDITTKELPNYLRRWSTYENALRETDAAASLASLVRAQEVLCKAREAVANYCAAKTLSIPEPRSAWPIDDGIAFSVIVLGEALSQALFDIQDNTSFNVNGWKSEVLRTHHWGYSGLVWKNSFGLHGLCPTKRSTLETLFKGNTVGVLLAAANVHTLKNHNHCKGNSCTRHRHEDIIERSLSKGLSISDAEVATAIDKLPKDLPPRHRTSSCNCGMVYADRERLAEIIRRGEVPLLEFKDSKSEEDGLDYLHIHAMKDRRADFVVFSHVWLDGYGNNENSGMHRCVYNYLKALCNNMRDLGGHEMRDFPDYFWIDSLAIPNGDIFRHARNIATRNIHEIYRRANYTIVLESGLYRRPWENLHIGTATRISVSQWMSRLWTLQEAFLSPNLYFAFDVTDELDRSAVISIDKIDQGVKAEDDRSNRCHRSVEVASLDYSKRLLRKWRRELPPAENSAFEPFADPKFVADVWRAVQFREPGRKEDEVLALAILFNLDVPTIAGPVPSQKLSAVDAERLSQTRMKNLLCALAQVKVDGQAHCCIPPGFIFLERPFLDIDGFGWAPKSWLTTKAVLSPDPLHEQFSYRKPQLHASGFLQVSFPGFLLHPMSVHSREKLFDENGKLFFPANSDQADWYVVEKADKEDEHSAQFEPSTDPRSLAIIALRLDVRQPREIALLVAIESEPKAPYHVEVLYRVWLSKERTHKNLTTYEKKFHGNLPDIFCGERQEVSTVWCIKGKKTAARSVFTAVDTTPRRGSLPEQQQHHTSPNSSGRSPRAQDPPSSSKSRTMTLLSRAMTSIFKPRHSNTID